MMTPSLRRVSVVVSIASLIALAADLSCKTFDTPAEICSPASQLETTAPGHQDGTCTRCLEDNCCDKVGVCERKENCSGAVSKTYDCVLKQGVHAAREETNCAVDGGVTTISEANDVYRCMRDSCGDPCGLPICRVDPSVVLFRNADCDGCFASSCCTDLNKCYGNRACKLSIECIVQECGAELGKSLIADRPAILAGTNMPPADAGDLPDFCGATAPTNFAAPECVRQCLCKYRNDEQGLEPVDPTLRPLVLALGIYTCGAVADCGPSCVGPKGDAGAD